MCASALPRGPLLFAVGVDHHDEILGSDASGVGAFLLLKLRELERAVRLKLF
jgi:hypothetical protein